MFTVTTPRYDDGRRQLRMPLEALFREAVERCNAAVIPGVARSRCGDVFTLDPAGAAIAYLDPPYAPPRDDTCYVKRYHFLEGLATYWRGQEIMWETRTRKLRKRHTPFGSKRTARSALDRRVRALRRPRRRSSCPTAPTPMSMPRNSRRCSRGTAGSVRRIELPHRYAFGTHARGGETARHRVRVRREIGPRLYSGRCRRW